MSDFEALLALKENPIKGPNPLLWEGTVLHGKKIHWSSCARGAKKISNTTTMKIEDIIEASYSCNCLGLTSFSYLEEDTHFSLESIETIVALINNLPSWEDIKDFTDASGAERYYQHLNIFFEDYYDGNENLISPVVTQWMHLNKGYPESPEEIITHYKRKVSAIAEENIALAIRAALVEDAYMSEIISYLVNNLGSDADKLNRILQKELNQPQRCVALFTPRDPGRERFRDFKDTVLEVFISDLNPDSGRLVAVPQLLAYAGIGLLSHAKVNLEVTPSPMELRTAQGLYSEEMTLEEALVSAIKLS